MKTLQSRLAPICLTLIANLCYGQVPGDGIPDIYYFFSDGQIVFTSVGAVSRPGGTLLVDTDGDGTDMIALLVGGADASLTTPDDGNYLTGSTQFLPDPNAAAPLFASQWTSGFINGSSQWVRTSPLDTPGFVGVIGEYDDPFGDPFGIFPDEGVANYGNYAQFDRIFDDGSGQLWEVVFATQSSGTIFTNVTGSCLSCNTPPVANDDEYTVTLGGTIDTIRDGLPGLLENDFDREGFPLIATGPGIDPSHGTVSIELDGSFVYTHDGSSMMTDTFTYFAEDYDFATEATVTINVVPEPTTSGLFGMACLGLFGPRRRGQ